MPYPTIDIPAYADLTPAILQWAVERELLHPDGTAHLATPWAQHAKTVEEISEAAEALSNLAACRRAAAAGPLHVSNGLVLDVDLVAARHDLALELGDVIVTLTLQAALQGSSIDECRARAGYITCPVHTWQYVDCHARGLGVAIDNYSKRIPSFIGVVARIVEDTARIELSLTGPECLALALNKIQGRQGQVVDGCFVKAS